MNLHMVELCPNLHNLLSYLHSQGFETRNSDDDFGYGIHAWLRAAFGQLAPQPWRLLMDRRRPTRILGYSAASAAQLSRHLQEFAEPSVAAVCADVSRDIASKPMPTFAPGRRLGFQVQCCPVGRKAGTGVEKDVFLIRADQAPTEKLEREAVYSDWLQQRLDGSGVTVNQKVSLSGFRLVRQRRQTQAQTNQRQRVTIVRPQAIMEGQLTVEDPVKFQELLSRGVGRHRAFGYGMLLVRPPR